MDRISFGVGWGGEEQTEDFSFRWMGCRANVRLSLPALPGRKVLKFRAGHSFPDKKSPELELKAAGKSLGTEEIRSEWSAYDFPLDGSGVVDLEFRLSHCFRIPEDTRDLGIMVSGMEVLDAGQEEFHFGKGWYGWEFTELFPFQWMAERSRICVPADLLKAKPLLTFYAFSEFADFSQTVTLKVEGEVVAEQALNRRWNYYSLDCLDPGSEMEWLGQEGLVLIDLELNKVFPKKYHPSDKRTLGIRMGQFALSDDREIHEGTQAFHRNAVLNDREMREGKTVLESHPLNLGIDLYGKCNITPPCVYCLWHSMKKLEGEDVNLEVNERTLEGYGPFFRSSRTLVNCSFGEPLFHPRFEQILELCSRHKKILEISTNGQAFTPRTIKALAGKLVYLYISLDASSPETYAKIRNEHWDEIVPNLVELDRARKAAGNLPKMFMVFMPMRVNRDDLEGYFRLCKTIDADALVLRPLLYLVDPEIEIERGGYLFDYKSELLNRREVDEVIKRAERLSKEYGVPLANQFDFGVSPELGKEDAGPSSFEFQRS